MRSETIFAQASGAGVAGVAVLRISGPKAGAVLAHLQAKDVRPRVAGLRALYAPASGKLLDRALVLWFPGPHSFTGEDCLELQVHGGRAVIDGVVGALGEMADLRPAEPGEFSRRAFDNGKMDLTEAEGLNDLIHAQTQAQAELALRQMDGALSGLYEGWRAKLVGHLAHLEADIDFPDEDLPEGVAGAVRGPLAELAAEVQLHLDDGRRGQALRDGYRVALIGAPNAGKSTLMNALARSDVAIVSDEAGTTRDVIEVQLDLGGFPVRLIDTAGVRDAANKVEAEGVRRAMARAAEADLRLILKPEGESLPAELADLLIGHVLLETQIDRVNPSSSSASDRTENPSSSSASDRTENPSSRSASGRTENPSSSSVSDRTSKMFHVKHGDAEPLAVHRISAKTGLGMAELLDWIEDHIQAAMSLREAPSLTRHRHRKSLEDVVGHLDRFQQNAGFDAVLAAEDVRMAARALGQITGRVGVEDILDRVFGDFCIGK